MSRLIDRLREAKEGSEELSAEVWRALCWRDHAREIALGSPLTESLDAAVSLCERVIPNFLRWTAGGGGREDFAYVEWRRFINADDWDRVTSPVAYAATAPLSLCLAVLLAKGEGE